MVPENSSQPEHHALDGLLDAIEVLSQHLKQSSAQDAEISDLTPEPLSAEDSPPLAHLVRCFDLTPFERDIIVMAAAMEFDSNFPALCAAASHNSNAPFPNLNLAWSISPNPDKRAFCTTSPLHARQLIRMGNGTSLGRSPFHLDPYILSFLLGDAQRDPDLDIYLNPVTPPDSEILPPSYEDSIAKLIPAARWQPDDRNYPLVEIWGSDRATRQQLVALASARFGRPLMHLSAATIPADTVALHELQQRWERQAWLSGQLLLVEAGDRALEAPLARFLTGCDAPMFVSYAQPAIDRPRSFISWKVPALSMDETQQVWTAYLGERSAGLEETIERLSDRFVLSLADIRTVCQQAERFPAESIERHLWQTCRARSRPQLDAIAQRSNKKSSTLGYQQESLVNPARGLAGVSTDRLSKTREEK